MFHLIDQKFTAKVREGVGDYLSNPRCLGFTS